MSNACLIADSLKSYHALFDCNCDTGSWAVIKSFQDYFSQLIIAMIKLKGNMNNPRLDSTLYRVYVPTSICTKSKKSKKSIDLVIPHYSDHISTEANIHIQSKQRQQMTWIKSRGSRDKTRSNTAVAIFQCSLILLICLDVEINVMDMVYCVAFGCNAIIYRKGETSPQVLFRHSSNTT